MFKIKKSLSKNFFVLNVIKIVKLTLDDLLQRKLNWLDIGIYRKSMCTSKCQAHLVDMKPLNDNRYSLHNLE